MFDPVDDYFHSFLDDLLGWSSSVSIVVGDETGWKYERKKARLDGLCASRFPLPSRRVLVTESGGPMLDQGKMLGWCCTGGDLRTEAGES